MRHDKIYPTKHRWREDLHCRLWSEELRQQTVLGIKEDHMVVRCNARLTNPTGFLQGNMAVLWQHGKITVPIWWKTGEGNRLATGKAKKRIIAVARGREEDEDPKVPSVRKASHVSPLYYLEKRSNFEDRQNNVLDIRSEMLTAQSVYCRPSFDLCRLYLLSLRPKRWDSYLPMCYGGHIVLMWAV